MIHEDAALEFLFELHMKFDKKPFHMGVVD
jgi:hypothetical protein